MVDDVKKIVSLSITALLIATIFATLACAQNDQNTLDPYNSTANNSTANNSTANNSTANNSTANNSTANNSTANNSTNNTNLLINANFTNGSTLADNWTVEQDVSGSIKYVTTHNMQSFCYKGQSGDNGTRKIKIYQAPITGVAAGDKIKFSILVSGNMNSSRPIIGIGAFNSSAKWIGESYVDINVSYTPQLYQVTYVCPQETNYVAVYLDCLKINPNSIIDLSLEKAELVRIP